MRTDYKYLQIFTAGGQDMTVPFIPLGDIFQHLRGQGVVSAVTGRPSSRRLLKSFVKVIVLLSSLFEQSFFTHNVKISRRISGRLHFMVSKGVSYDSKVHWGSPEKYRTL